MVRLAHDGRGREAQDRHGVRLRILLPAVVVACCLASAAHAGGLLVGVDDDSLEWTASTARVVAAQHALGVTTVRATLTWRRGLSQLDGLDELYMRRMGRAVHLGDRVVLEVYGGAADAPGTARLRTRYCAFVVEALQRARSVHDVVIWNEANSPRFWPQTPGAPAAYEALLAQCWDAIHAVRPGVNVISSTAPHYDPASFIAGVGAAYRASGRTLPVFDTFGHNVYPDSGTEAPDVLHVAGASLDEGDYGRLMATLESAFGGTAQPVPGQGAVRIWYLEDGFETTVPDAKRGFYRGRELDRRLLAPIAHPGQLESIEPDQATQLAAAIALASCQPAVGAFFNFQLADDPSLAGWQSGLLFADWTPKPSYARVRAAIAAAVTGTRDCTQFPEAALGA
jgi:hypothetical protein